MEALIWIDWVIIALITISTLINNMIGHLVRATGLSATDRVLGMGFGLLRGLVVVIVAIAFIRYTPLAQDTWWRTSVMIDRLGVVEDWSRRTFGDEFARFLEPESQKAVEPTSASS